MNGEIEMTTSSCQALLYSMTVEFTVIKSPTNRQMLLMRENNTMIVSISLLLHICIHKVNKPKSLLDHNRHLLLGIY